MANRSLVIVPTYNEIENITQILTALAAKAPEVDVLVVDDSSPDGTAAAVTNFANSHSNVHLLSREKKNGLAGAYIAGFKWGLEKGYEQFVQMDADFSHSPADVPRLLKALETYDQAMGSRYIKGGSTSGWTLPRILISRGGNIYAKSVLGLPYKDLTGGFNAHRRKVLETIGLEQITSRGYAFQVEIKYRTYKKGFSQVELPILFENRKFGESKMSQDIVKEAALKVLQLRHLQF
ncbi:MAG: polyprenol monophosphomannose synthase [Proteobacteria bacterium]|nr:polyprenol monophosphomannose synthase [Pseudomonadota bacterium]NBY20317.1 polyprenol monophosphomannose synthase [bacterium]